jgi:hypothetical protein
MFDQIASPSDAVRGHVAGRDVVGTTISTRPSIVSGTGTGAGGGRCSPFTSSTRRRRPAERRSAGRPSPGRRRAVELGGSPSSRGSAISPRSAVAAAVAGEQR